MVVILKAIADFGEEDESFSELGFLFVLTFGAFGEDLEHAAKAAHKCEEDVLRLAIPLASAHLCGLSAFGSAGLGYPPLGSVGGVVVYS